MARKIMLVQGHPDASETHYCHAIENAYVDGAREAGHEVRVIRIAELQFPLLRSAAEFSGELPPALSESAEALKWADHLVLIYPLWLGTMPALVKAWLEQVFRPGVALEQTEGWPRRMLKNKSCRVVVTMGMPAFAYRWYFRAHSLKSLERNVLKFAGIRPVREALIGMVAAPNPRGRERWLEKVGELGRRAV
ncbi:MAG: NAD(P)H-dependent oxidoreductase [Pseudohongiellaceae bacterium]